MTFYDTRQKSLFFSFWISPKRTVASFLNMGLVWNEKTGLPYIGLDRDRTKWDPLNITERLFTAWSKRNNYEESDVVMGVCSFERRINVKNGCGSTIINEEEFEIPMSLLALNKAKEAKFTHMAIGCIESDFQNGRNVARVVAYLAGFIRLDYEDLFFKPKYTKDSGLPLHGVKVNYKEYIIIEYNEIHSIVKKAKEEEELVELLQPIEIKSDQPNYYVYVFHGQAPTKMDRLFLKDLLMTTVNGTDKFSLYTITRVKFLSVLYNSRYIKRMESVPKYLLKEIEETIPITDIQSYDMERFCLWFLVTVFCRDENLKNWFIQAEALMLEVNLDRVGYQSMKQVMRQNEMELPKDDKGICYDQYMSSVLHMELKAALDKATNVQSQHPYFAKLSEKCISIVNSHLK